MSSTPISTLSDFPLLPSAIDRESGKKSSLAPVIHLSLSGWHPEKNRALIQRTIAERSETTDVASEREVEYDSDKDGEVNNKDYLTKRSQELADEYIRKTDFRLVNVRR